MTKLRPICNVTNDMGLCKGCINQDALCSKARAVADELARRFSEVNDATKNTLKTLPVNNAQDDKND